MIIGLLWGGVAFAGGAVYDYTPEPFGMDFSTAPKPHMPAPGAGEWHVISGDGTIYPDIINYCDPETDPECLGHFYVACQAWITFAQDEKGRHIPPICKEVGVSDYNYPYMLMGVERSIKQGTLYYYKLDIWKPEGMLYHWQSGCELPPIEYIPFREKFRSYEWLGEYNIDIYYGYCEPHDECLYDNRNLTTEADRNCPITNCKEYGFEKQEEAYYLNHGKRIIYPQGSIGFPLFDREDKNKEQILNFFPGIGVNVRSCIIKAPARWFPEHPMSEYNERVKN